MAEPTIEPHGPGASTVADRVELGRSGLRVPRLAFGTAPLASIFWDNVESTAIEAARRALELGIRYFDTAPLYGLGESESRLGAALAAAPADDVVIATKAGRNLVVQPDGSRDSVFDFGYDAALRSIEGSLERLGVDRVQIVHVHDPDDDVDEALEGTTRALVALRQQGVIAAVSVGTNSVATAGAFVERADVDAVMVAGRYTLLDQQAADLVDRCTDRGIAYLAAGVFNSGILARPVEGAWFDYGPADASTLERTRAIDAVCARHGVPLRTAAARFPLTRTGVTAVVLGMASPAEVDENLAALDADIPPDLWRELTDEACVSDG